VLENLPYLGKYFRKILLVWTASVLSTITDLLLTKSVIHFNGRIFFPFPNPPLRIQVKWRGVTFTYSVPIFGVWRKHVVMRERCRKAELIFLLLIHTHNEENYVEYRLPVIGHQKFGCE
jgi:hypothetical protein